LFLEAWGTHMTKLVVAFRTFANASNNGL
jgi:hypothetical protein